MQCPRCGMAIPNGARFCMNCGVAFVPMGAAGAPAQAAPLPARTSRRWVIGLAVAALAILLAFVLGASGLLRFGRQGPDSYLRSSGAVPGSSLQVQKTPENTGVTLSAPPEGKKMPEDVRAWLEHLRKCEEKRVSLSNEQLAKMMVTMTRLSLGGADEMLKGLINDDPSAPNPPAPTQRVQNETGEMKDKWANLSAEFNSFPPPTECRPIRDDYDQALRETGGMMVDVMSLFSNAADNPQAAITALMEMRGKSAGRIDAVAERADTGVQAICDKYDTKKWFKIVRDIGSGGMLGQYNDLPSIPALK